MVFVQAKVSVGHDEGRKYHFFKCASVKCKGKGQKGVRHYLDLKDHAVKCFGQDAVKATFKKTQSGGCDGSIFAVFTHQGQQPVKISHCTHTTEESGWVLDSYFECSHLRNTRAHIVRWCAKNNHPHRIVKDCQFEILMKARQPGTSLPSPITASCDIKAVFEHCCEHIDTILKVCLPIGTMGCLFNHCIGTLWACTICNWCVDISKPPGSCLHRQYIYTTAERSWYFYLTSSRYQR